LYLNLAANGKRAAIHWTCLLGHFAVPVWVKTNFLLIGFGTKGKEEEEKPKLGKF
jgi:hypothetical protein